MGTKLNSKVIVINKPFVFRNSWACDKKMMNHFKFIENILTFWNHRETFHLLLFINIKWSNFNWSNQCGPIMDSYLLRFGYSFFDKAIYCGLFHFSGNNHFYDGGVSNNIFFIPIYLRSIKMIYLWLKIKKTRELHSRAISLCFKKN